MSETDKKEYKLDGTHTAFFCFKVFLLFFAAADLFTLLAKERGTAGNIDLMFDMVKTVLLAVSVILHQKKAGAIAFLAYGAVQLLFAFAAVRISGVNDPDITTQLISVTIGTAVIFIPAALYYIHRWNQLK